MTRHRSLLLAAVLLVTPALATGCPSATPEPRDVDAAGVHAGPRDATLLLMADIRGVLRPCGCTVDLQKGGFDRLVPYLAKERERYPDAALLHAGPMFFEDGSVDPDKAAQRVRQSEVTAELVARVRVDMAAATAADAAASNGKLKALGEGAHLKLTAANLKLADGPEVSPYEVENIGGVRVGVFALASPDEAEHLGARGTIEDPGAAAERTVAALKGRADVVVLLSALGLRNTKRLVRKVPGIDFAVVGGMGEHPSVSEEAELVGTTRVMQFHREGRFIGRLALRVVGDGPFVDASQASPAEIAALDSRIARLKQSLADWEAQGGGTDHAIRSAKHHLASLEDERDKLAARKVEVPRDRNSFSFTLTPLNWDLPQDPDTLALMTAFEQELAQINIANAGTLPEPKEGEPYYVGARACFDCHEGPERFWKNDRHHDAWKTLEDDHKTFDAECVSCHVTGYKQPGGSLVGQVKGRKAVQCEACHGPGSAHLKDTKNPALIIGHPTAEVCQKCHNHHHSPSFDFSVYKPRLMVPGHGLPPLPEDAQGDD
ncbi:MAG: hypothetical protein EP329_00585 [Deltaproteobacteria bacterium]|nr:MAG: hypothetical protein EP329_00585 [Deltaproteobacteria bacterium]